MSGKKQDSSWKNVKNWSEGKDRLKVGILQHPEEDAGDKSIYNYMKGNVTKRKKLHIMPFKQYETIGKGK